MSSSTNETIALFTYLTLHVNAVLAPPIFVLGMIGNAINIWIFTRKSLQKNPCSIYFCSASIVSLLALCSGLMSRLLGGYSIDLTTWNSVLCKLRFYFYYLSIVLLSWFLVFASLDRFLSTSQFVNYRKLSCTRVAYRLVFCSTVFNILLYLQVFYCFIADPNQYPIQCYAYGDICRTFNDLEFLIIYSLLPAILMGIFGCLTVRNIQQMERRIDSTTNIPNCRQKRIQLVPMLLVQIAFFLIFTIPLAVTKFYNTLIVLLHLSLTPEHRAFETFVFNITVLVSYLNCSISFYVYTLAGNVFRQELKKTAQQIVAKIRC
ncbi:unnamed protein product [Adineta ricciae]|uniref:G-protein coupled receptors family 1 profile domain-containing protein n=1 Tax=Adineta ricciae TaxID=249248 RepID=A0A814QLD8_ADIRI|nr:unnamed protein product [Adineta ricciae]CAF1120604.1 unnamed protein product [Adineta ricciae]